MNINAILVPVDGSASSLHAVEFALQAVRGRDDIALHVLTVQAPIISGNVRRFISAETIADYYQDEGRQALQAAKTVLDESGVAYQAHIQVGPIAETIHRFAGEHGCGLIVMGTRGLGSVTGLLMGSVATKVLSLADVPVTLVK
ncbi:universal stress protein [Castellaniella sp.]|uniref:universal stress protein n=1 Tax=Castellaniella sp. TaxID=1955812 RepID=UPI002B0038FE|nr:universal stress protein [Castellaniella sp.]